MTNPSVLSLVAKMECCNVFKIMKMNMSKIGLFEFLKVKILLFQLTLKILTVIKPFYSEPAYGYHYVFVASPNSKDTFATIDPEQWSNVLVVVQDRLRWLYTQKGVTYVSIYGDHGEACWK